MSKEAKVIVKATGKEINVYKHREKGTWISEVDFQTQYKPEELKFL